MLYARHLFEDAHAWEHTRLINYTLYCANTTDKVKPSLQDYFPLLTDNFEPKVEDIPMSIDERLSLQQMAQDRLSLVKKK